jgi:type I restriction enzyme S subunit
MSWMEVALSEVCTTITDGAHSSPPSREDGYPMGSVKDMTDLGIDLSGCRKISADDYHKLCASGCKPYEGDVLIAKDGNSCLQTVCVHKRTIDMVLLSSVAILRPDPNKCDSRFLKYHLANPATKAALKNYVSGVAIPRVVLRDFKNYRFSIPTLGKQKQIGSFLGAYDDLIENNKRRIELLEDSARQLYKEWFVRFRFPGHEHVKIIDGMPEEWTNGVISDLGEVITGKTPSTKSDENFGGAIPFIKTPDMHGNTIVIKTEQCLTERGASTQANKLIPRNSILVSCIGTIGVTSINAFPAHTNQQINSVVPNYAGYTYFAFFALAALKARMEAMGGGATMANVNKAKFSGLPVIIPSTKLLESFHEIVAPIFGQIETLATSSHKLSEARDLLLPKLMSGEIAV